MFDEKPRRGRIAPNLLTFLRWPALDDKRLGFSVEIDKNQKVDNIACDCHWSGTALTGSTPPRRNLDLLPYPDSLSLLPIPRPSCCC
ncbi:hypothetical protein SAY87_023251 [Trapa incisa]|uniref:Uncharacterized protein n=1 Tax=Trapa incisa TaxID=236973 RepID=A0AAN7KBL9_9MYRT|nr:hypothetical protein SAY87_023251 [Trapa incisa]